MSSKNAWVGLNCRADKNNSSSIIKDCLHCMKHSKLYPTHNYDIEALKLVATKEYAAYHCYCKTSKAANPSKTFNSMKKHFKEFQILKYFCTHYVENKPHCHFILLLSNEQNSKFSRIRKSAIESGAFGFKPINDVSHLINVMNYIGNTKSQTGGVHSNITIKTNPCSAIRLQIYDYVFKVVANRSIDYNLVSWKHFSIIPEAAQLNTTQNTHFDLTKYEKSFKRYAKMVDANSKCEENLATRDYNYLKLRNRTIVRLPK